MRLIVDVNIIFAAVLRDSKTREMLMYPFFEYFSPEFTLEEIENVKAELVKRAEQPELAVSNMLSEVLKRITIFPKEYYTAKISEAKKLLPKIHDEDLPYIALALSIPVEGIWSNDTAFSDQTKVKIWRTADILEMFKK